MNTLLIIDLIIGLSFIIYLAITKQTLTSLIFWIASGNRVKFDRSNDKLPNWLAVIILITAYSPAIIGLIPVGIFYAALIIGLVAATAVIKVKAITLNK